MKKENVHSVEYYTDFQGFLRALEKYEKRDAVTWYSRKQEKYTKTYGELLEDVYALQNAFVRRNFPGKHIAVAGENSYAWIVVYLAAVSCGAVVVCIDTEQSEENLLKMVRKADAEVVFASTSCRELFSGEPYEIYEMDAGEQDAVDLLIAEGARTEAAGAKEPSGIRGEDTAVIAFTSGTTDGTKPVMLSHRGILTNACECNVYVKAGEKIYSFLPFCHTYGMTSAVLATFCRGAQLVLNGNTKMAMRDLVLSEAYSMLTVPLTVEVLYKQFCIRAQQLGREEELKKLLKRQRFMRKIGMKQVPKELNSLVKEIFGTIRLIICGGAYLNLEIAENLELLGITVVQGYGITECSPIVSVNSEKDNRMKTVGRVIPSCNVRIVDGEIEVSGPCVMNGYYKMPEETKKVLMNGWFRTGDLGELGKDGFLRITGRRKNLIVFKNGKKVSPETYEEKLRRLPFVEEVMVYGASSGKSEDDVKIAVSIYPKKELSERMSSYEILEELQKEVDVLNNTLPLYQQIQIIHIREKEFEKTTTRKIKRYVKE